MKVFFLFASILWSFLNLQAAEKSTVYDTNAEEMVHYNKVIGNFFDTHGITIDQYSKTKNLFYKIFTKNLRKRFCWADSIQKGEENPERIGIPGSVAVTTGLLTCIVTAANPYYTAITMATTALIPPVVQGISNYSFQRFITKLNGTYGTYIGLKKKPRTPFEDAVLDRIWQRYQFPLLLLKDQSVASVATELLEQLFHTGLEFSSDFKKDFLFFITEKIGLHTTEPVHDLLRYGADRNKESVLGTHEQAVQWLATAFTTGMGKKPYCCTFYHRFHTALKICANIRNFEHPCKADCYSIYGVPLTISDILKSPAIDYSSEEKAQSYFSSFLLQKIVGKKPVPVMENNRLNQEDLSSSDISIEVNSEPMTDYDTALTITAL